MQHTVMWSHDFALQVVRKRTVKFAALDFQTKKIVFHLGYSFFIQKFLHFFILFYCNEGALICISHKINFITLARIQIKFHYNYFISLSKTVSFCFNHNLPQFFKHLYNTSFTSTCHEK
jgi:hypothetical protein